MTTHLTQLGVDVAVMRLEYPATAAQSATSMGDACWEGRGPHGAVQVGVERKRLSDLIKCMEDRRLAGHQLMGMRKVYAFVYLVAEGCWRPGPTGAIEILGRNGWQPYYNHGGRPALYDQIDGFLDSLGLRGGVEVIRTAGSWETACVYANRYKRWQRPWESHHSHDAIYCPDPDAQFGGRVSVHAREPGPVERFAATLPDVDRRSWKVGEYFRSVRQAANADVGEWREALGFKSGTKVASGVVEWIRRGEDNGNQTS